MFFWADHGSGYPRTETYVYDDGLRVPLIVRFPDKYQHLAPSRPGTAVDDLVMHMDLRPSMLSLAGMPGPEHFQGRVLFGPQKNQPRDYVCSARDRLDNCNEVIRTIRTEKYRYIRDFLPHRPYAPLYPDGGFFREVPPEGTSARDFWETSCLLWEQKIHDPDGVFLMPISEDFKQYLVRQDSKSCEELHDIENDPEEIHNLANAPEFHPIKEQLRKKHFDRMVETHDLGHLDETEIVARTVVERGSVNYEVGVHCDNIERVLETADLARLGEKGKRGLVECLDDPDSVVRYWAVTGLMSFDWNDGTTQKLVDLLEGESIAVSPAAADALARTGQAAITTPALCRVLEIDLHWG